MKLAEINTSRPNLHEMLETEADHVEWRTLDGFKHRGAFELDGSEVEIELDEYDAIGLHLVDFGFSVNGSVQFVGDERPSSRLAGAVLNAARGKIAELDPDLVLISVKKGTGKESSRRSSYDVFAARLIRQRLFHHTFSTDWLENDAGWYKIFSKEVLSSEQLGAVLAAVAS